MPNPRSLIQNSQLPMNPSPFSTHHSLFTIHISLITNNHSPIKNKNAVQTGTTSITPRYHPASRSTWRPDSLGRANGRWTSPVNGFGRCHLLHLRGWRGEFSLGGAPQRRPGFHWVVPTRWRMAYYSCRDVCVC